MDDKTLKNILEAGLLVAGRTLNLAQLEALFQHADDDERPDRKQIREALDSLKQDYEGRGIELVEVASGFRLQSHESVSEWVANLFQEKTPRYSRALLETLVLIAYRQPITRAEIEEVRGVAVSTNIIKTLQERQWVKVLGHKDVPGKPALLGTTKEFLDYFNLKKLDELPELSEIKDLDQFDELLAEEVGEVGEQGADAANDDDSDNCGGEASGRREDTDLKAAGDSDESQVDHSQNDDDQSEQSEDDQDQSGNDNKIGDGTESGEFSASAAEQSGDNLDSQSDEILDLGSSEVSSEDSSEDISGGISPPQNVWPTKNASGESDVEDINEAENSEDDDGAEEHNETLTGPELDLLRVIADFSEEHQQEVDARNEMEARTLSKNRDNEEEDIDLSDLSQRIGDDKQSGDGPEPGDTLH